MKHILAALIFFTRLPFWKLGDVPAECFKNVVRYWPFVGWLTGGIMAGVYFMASFILPLPCAVLLALVARLLATGALHEDGFADFVDGFGGGTSRQRILEIMKDSHIGTYGVIALVIYFLMMVALASTLPVHLTCAAFVTCDTWSKYAASNIVNFLPYARKENEAKNHTVYNRTSITTGIVGCIGGLITLLLLPLFYLPSLFIPISVSIFLFRLMKKRIQGYTGDCCGATFIICELSMWITIVAINTFLS
ncbi:MAG: adenosylcobinamide-GDP ribazoletransferase [Paramuribaculum sp.]|nr:adenosylcobinamide-GDP ribazoletransferase [Paramuribaculum sp.]